MPSTVGALSTSLDAVREAVLRTKGELAADVAKGRGWSQPVSATWEGGLRFRSDSPTGGSMTTDMSPKLGGTGGAASPGWYFRAAIATCVGTVIAQRAAIEGISLDHLEVTVESEGDVRGMLGMDESIPAGFRDSRVKIRIAARDVPEDRLRALAQWGEAHSPMSEALSRAVPKRVEVQVTSP